MVRFIALMASACLFAAPFISCLPERKDKKDDASDEIPAPDPTETPEVVELGPVYGNAYGSLVRIPTDGAPHETLYPNHAGTVIGMTLGKDGQYLYFTALNGDVPYLARIDFWLAQDFPPAAEVLAWAPDLGKHAYGLATDSLGRVYMQGNGKLVRFNPATPADGLETVSSSFGPFWNIAISPADEAYGSKFMLSGASDTWITRLATYVIPGGGAFLYQKAWAQAPADEPANFVVSGMCINAKGEGFIMNSTGTRLYRYADLNGNGDALDLEVEVSPGVFKSERTVFSQLPGAESETMVFGMTAVKGNGVLINRQMYNGGPLTNTGVFLLKDLDGDGSADDAGERTVMNSGYVYQGLDAGCLSAAK